MNLFQRRKPPAQETAPQFFGGTDNVPQPKAVLPQSTFMENLRKLSVSDIRTKPSYSDCWLIGNAGNLDKIEEYDTPSGHVVIGISPDGETEYNLTPAEYTSSDSINSIIEELICKVRKEFRKSGGRSDRLYIDSLTEDLLAGYADGILVACGGNTQAVVDMNRRICDIVYRYTVGLGVFDVLLSDPRLEDIYIDAPCDKNRIHVTLSGIDGTNGHGRCRTNLIVDRREVMNLICHLKRISGLPYGQSNPVLETDMGSYDARATVVGYPLSPNGDAVAIRKHSVTPWTLTRLMANGTLDPYTAGLLSFLVQNRAAFLVCGARGAGKSSLLSAMMFEFPKSQRILTVEDTIELPFDAGLTGFPKASERTSGSSSSLGDIPWDNIKPSTQETGPGPDVRMDVRRAVSFTVTGTNSNGSRSSAALSTATNRRLRGRDATTSSPTTPAWNPSARPIRRNSSNVFSINWGACASSA